MKKVSKLPAIVLALVMIVSLFSGCGTTATQDATKDTVKSSTPTQQATEAPKEAVKINFPSMWVQKDAKAKMLGQIISDFNVKNKGKIEVAVEEVPDTDAYRNKIKISLAGGQVPDFFIINEAGKLKLDKYAKSNRLMDWTPYLNEDTNWKDGFYNGVLKDNTWDDKVMMLPIELMAVPVIYNKELFDKAGIKEFPKTMDDYFKACDALLAANIIPISMALNQGPDNWFTNQLVSDYACSVAGKDIVSEACEGKVAFTDKAFIEAGNMLQKAVKYFPKDVFSADYNKACAYYNNGQAAMLGNGAWMFQSIKTDGKNNLYDKTLLTGAPGTGAWIKSIGSQYAAAAQEDKDKEKAVAEFGKYLTSADSVKKLYLDSGATFCVKFDLKDGEGDKLSADALKGLQNAPFTTTTILFAAKPNVQKVFSDNVTKLIANKMSSEDFWKMIEDENQKN